MDQRLADPIVELKEACPTCLGTKYSEGLKEDPAAEARYNPPKSPTKRKTNSL